jgi:hypothetical protein
LLSNVRHHAGTGSASVTARQDADVGLRVEVRDEGVGFDPRRCRPDRLGLRESVAGRMADVGGSTEIRSSPGAGTTVVLSWRPGSPAGDVKPGEGGPGEAAESGLERPAAAARLRRDYAAGLRRAVGAVAAAWQVLLLVPLAASWRRYPAPGVAVALWLLLAAAAIPAVRVLHSRALHRREAAVLVLVAAGGALAMGLHTRADDVTRIVNWYGAQAVPLLLTLVAASRPAREWAPAALLADAVVVGVGVSRAGTDPVALSRLFAASYVLWTILLIVAALGPALRSTAEATAGAAEAEAALAARREAARAVGRDRRRRHRHLQAEILPLLRGIADGAADPRTDAVRRACAAQAAQLRRRLSTSARPGLLDRLEAAVEAAEARGIAIQVQLAGDLAHAPAAVRTEVVDAVGEALRTVPSGPALLTVWCSEAGGSAYVTFPAGGGPGAPARSTVTGSGTGLTQVHSEVEDGRACLEVRW